MPIHSNGKVLETRTKRSDMKDLWKSGVLILLIIGVLYIIFLRECKHPLPCPAQDEVIIKRSTWDSILALADKPPIIKIDTIIIKGETVYISVPMPYPVPNSQDTTINQYSDTLLQKDIDVIYDFKVQGVLIDRTWRYRPTYTYVTKDSIIYVPHIVEVVKPVYQPANRLYGNFVFGGNKSAFLFGGGVDYITKKDTQFGYMYQRYGDENFHSIKLGVNLFRRSPK